MYTKQQLLASIAHETKVIKHLATQVPAGKLDYRPTPAQRSTLELMRYLTVAGSSAARYAVEGEYETWWDAMEAETAKVEPATFAKAMDRQRAAITRLLAKFTDAKLAKRPAKTWGGKPLPLSEALIEMVLKPLVAYRMQLFLYAKASGASHIGTSDCWAGKPAKAKKAAASA